MREVTMNELMREDGSFDYKRYQELTNNYWEHGRLQICTSLLEKSSQPEKEEPRQVMNYDGKDNISISQESLELMEEMKKNRVSLEDVEYMNPLENTLNMTGTVTYIAKLSEVGEELMKQGKAKGAGLMGSAYDILRDEIISRYSDPDYKPGIVVEEGGETAHLMTMEEELAILDEAYEYIAEFHATSAREMAKFRGDHSIAEELYERKKQEYLDARSTRELEKLKQKVEHVQGQKLNLRELQRSVPMQAGFFYNS